MEGRTNSARRSDSVRTNWQLLRTTWDTWSGCSVLIRRERSFDARLHVRWSATCSGVRFMLWLFSRRIRLRCRHSCSGSPLQADAKHLRKKWPIQS